MMKRVTNYRSSGTGFPTSGISREDMASFFSDSGERERGGEWCKELLDLAAP